MIVPRWRGCRGWWEFIGALYMQFVSDIEPDVEFDFSISLL